MTSVKTIAYQGEACISPLNTQLIVIWARSNNESDGTCECGVWTQIAKCRCIDDSNFFNVYNKEEQTKRFICWRNLNNNTVITAIIDYVNTHSGDNVPVLNRRVIESFYMIIPGEELVKLRIYSND